jgi:hypothetical protein
MPRRPISAARAEAPVVWLAVALGLAVGSSCFSPRFESGKLQCPGQVCPQGFYCAPLDGRCWRLGETPRPADGGGVDGPGAQAPTVLQAATASPSPVLGTNTALSVLADDLQGEAGLAYTWSVLGAMPGKVGYTDNGSNASKNTTAIFTAAGHYTFAVAIENRHGLAATSMVEVEVQQRINDMALNPSMATVAPGGTQQFQATAFDQFGEPLSLPIAVRWMVTGACGVVNDAGLFQATATGGACGLTATSGTVMVTATVSVGTAMPMVLAPVADAFVEDGSPDRNFGSAATLLVKTQNDDQNNRVSYLRFVLPNPPGPVSAAKLRMFGKTEATTHFDGVFVVNDHSWTETAITWRNRPPLAAKQTRVGVTTAPKYHEWDVTPLVLALQAAGESTMDVAIQMDASTNDGPDIFESREAANKPQLVLSP